MRHNFTRALNWLFSSNIRLIILLLLVASFFQFYRAAKSPPCMHDDEASFAYNAYTLWKTGKDEHGHLLPWRLKSYGDDKLPLYAYLAIPSVAVFGPTKFAVRLPNAFALALVLISFYYFVLTLTKKKPLAFLSTFILSAMPWVYLLTRQVHEGVITTALLIFAMTRLYRFAEKKQSKDFYLAWTAAFISSFGYHFARLYLGFLFLWTLIIFWDQQQIKGIFKSKNLFKILLAGLVFLIPFIIDIINGANRVNFLFFFRDPGFVLRINEFNYEHGLRLLHNKLVEGGRELAVHYLYQFSPEFFLRGDENNRYTFSGMGLISPFEIIALLIGIYYLFKNKLKGRFLILSLLLFSALPNTLTSATYSALRNYFMVVPIAFLAGYGTGSLFKESSKLQKLLIFSPMVLGYFAFLIINWDMYFYHFPVRAITIHSWQCGREEVAAYVQQNYSRFKDFMITNRDGQGYMFMLALLKYDPHKYLAQHVQYEDYGNGFLTVYNFDKFHFRFSFNPKQKHVAYIGKKEDLSPDIPLDKLKYIKVGTEEMFWIYEVK